MHFKNLLAQSLLWRGTYFISLLLVNVFLSRFLQASGIGWVYYLSNIFAFIQLLASLSIESAISFFAAGSLISYNKLICFSIAWSLFATLVAVGSMLLFFIVSGNHFEGNQEQYILYATSYIGGILLTNFSTSLFYAQRNFLFPNLIIVIINLGFILLIPKTSNPFIPISTGSLLNIYFLLFFIQGFILMICFIIKNKSWHQFSLPTLNELKKLFRYSLFAFAANIIFFLVYRIDFWFVRHSLICSDADLGNYIQVSKLGQMLLIFPQIMASAVFPQVASGLNKAYVQKTILIIIRLLSIGYIFLLIIVFLFGKSFFPWLFGHSFQNMYYPFILLLPGIFSVSVLSLISAYFGGIGKVSVNVWGALMALLVVAVADYIFIPIYGIYAAAIISTIGYTLNMIYSFYSFYKIQSFSLREIFVWRKSDVHWLFSLMVISKN